MAKVRCPHASCGFESKPGVLSGFKGIKCPNCESQSLIWRGGDNKDFQCCTCRQLYYAIPCPKCGTRINKPLFLGIL